MSTSVPSYFQNIPAAASEPRDISANRYCPVAIPKHLMPYEAAAKAIFIRANGGPAYYKATGIIEKKIFPE